MQSESGYTDQELQEIPAKDINKILSTMKAEEAFDFLERIGRLRAWLIYASLAHLPEHNRTNMDLEIVFSRLKPAGWPLLHAAVVESTKTLCGKVITAEWDGDGDCTENDVECKRCHAVIIKLTSARA